MEFLPDNTKNKLLTSALSTNTAMKICGPTNMGFFGLMPTDIREQENPDIRYIG